MRFKWENVLRRVSMTQHGSLLKSRVLLVGMGKMLIYILRPIRIVLIVLVALSFLVTGYLSLLFVWDKWKRRHNATLITQFYTRMALVLAGIRVNVKSQVDYHTFKGMTVGNHLSYLDIFILSTTRPSSYITSLEMKETPFLGNITDMGGCLYVDRRNKSNIRSEIADITEGLNRGFAVTVFPEATSTNGESVIRFRRALFSAAIAAEKPVLPMVINYRKIDGQAVDLSNRDDVCWYGDMGMGGHLWRLMSHRRIEVDLEFLEPIYDVKGKLPEDLANEAHARVSAHYKPIQ